MKSNAIIETAHASNIVGQLESKMEGGNAAA